MGETESECKLKYRPLFPCGITPQMIIGQDMPLIERHLKFWLDNQSKAGNEKANTFEEMKYKNFSHGEIETAAAIWRELREHGFHQDGFDQFGKIKWCVDVDQQGTKHIYDQLPKGPFSKQEIRNMVSEFYRRFNHGEFNIAKS